VLYLPAVAALSLPNALRQIDDAGLDLPLILVAGAEERDFSLQRAMKAGARDVIDADRLERLMPAIEREVREARHRADHRAALEMLNESQARFDALASNLPGMLFHLRRDAEGEYRFLFVSEGCQKLFGFKQQHLLASAEQAVRRLRDRQTQEPRKCPARIGRERHAAQLGRPHPRPHPAEVDQPALDAASLRQRRRRMARHRQQHHREQGKRSRAARSRQQLAELSTHLEAVKEEERERISRDIHDELGSILVFPQDRGGAACRQAAGRRVRLREKARSIETLLDQAMSTASRVARELRPGILKEFGLPAAIECQAEDFTQRFGIACRVQCDEEASSRNRIPRWRCSALPRRR
jgi:two-component system sensor histidine kinase UhpB